MGKKIVITFSLVFMLAMSVIGEWSLSDITAVSPAEARIKGTFKGVRLNVNPDKLSRTALGTPATVMVTDNAVTMTPNEAGALAQYKIRFVTGAALQNGIDTIILTFEDDFQVPTSIDRNDVFMSATAVTGNNGLPNMSVQPLAVTVDFVGPENDEPEITISVPDMDPDDNTGGNGIAAGATVTLIFPQSANLRNPTEGNEGGYDVRIATSLEPTPATASVAVPFIVELSLAGGSRNRKVTLVGKGFRNATTTTFWRDADGDGTRDPGEFDLCRGIATDDDVATCNFTVTNPPFAPRRGTDCTFGALNNCNFINAIDGHNNDSTVDSQADVYQQTYNLQGLVTTSPRSGDPGDTLTIQLWDFSPGLITEVTVGGVAVDGVNQTVPASGELNFTINIPNGVPTGVQSLAVREPGPRDIFRRTNVHIGGATIVID
jgi:hypothetical protein